MAFDPDDEELEATRRLHGVGRENKYMWYRFKTKAIEDYRPSKDMKDIQCPWWCSGEGIDYAIIVCYLPLGVNLKEYWDDAYDIDSEEKIEITYTDRFKKPEWLQ